MKLEIYETRSPSKLGSINIDSGAMVPVKGDIIKWRGRNYKVKRRYILYSEDGKKGNLTVQLFVKKR